MNQYESILDRLYRCCDNGQSPSVCFDYAEICDLVNSDEEEIRAWVAKAMINHDSQREAVSWLCQLAKDQDALVRVEAVDSLRAFVCQQSFETLLGALDDTDALVRGYAAFGVAVVGNVISPEEAKAALLKLETIEKTPRVFVDVYEGLYVLGKSDALHKLFALIETDDYQVQCAVIHACEEIVSDSNRDMIKNFLSAVDTFASPTVEDTLHNVKIG